MKQVLPRLAIARHDHALDIVYLEYRLLNHYRLRRDI
jgi:hypothetical protein